MDSNQYPSGIVLFSCEINLYYTYGLYIDSWFSWFTIQVVGFF
jgi:hypothetical protein